MFVFLNEVLLLVYCYYLEIERPEDEDTTEAGLLLGPKRKGTCSRPQQGAGQKEGTERNTRQGPLPCSSRKGSRFRIGEDRKCQQIWGGALSPAVSFLVPV